MSMMPKGFIGSSKESLEIARTIQTELDRDAEIVVWDQGVFEPSEYALQSLLQTVRYYDFAIFVLSPDDLARIRDQEHRVVRDNVIFELGLFFGAKGKEGAFMVVPRNSELHLPTDLLGLGLLDYDPSKSNPRAALGSACSTIRSMLKRRQVLAGPISFSLLTSPTYLTQYGLAEVLGDVRIVKSSIPPNLPQMTTDGNLTIHYSGVYIANCFSGPKSLDCSSGRISDDGGITITFDSDYLHAEKSKEITASTTNTHLGGELSIHIPAGITIRDDGTSISVAGVRADCSSNAVGSTVFAHVSAHPIKAGSFLSTNPVTVAQVNPSVRVQVTSVIFKPDEAPKNPTIRLTEGFAEAFVQCVNSAENAGRALGGNTNTQLRIQLSMPMAGLELTWPALVESAQGIGSLVLIGSSRAVALYEFRTRDQRKSDSIIEVFEVIPEVRITSAAAPGDVFIQVQMWPDATSVSIPRYSHPLINDPPDILVRVRR